MTLAKEPLVVPGAAVLAKGVRTEPAGPRHGLVPLGLRRLVPDRPSHEQLNLADPVVGGVRDLEEVILRSARINLALDDTPIRVCWPEQVLRSTYGLTGYVSRLPDAALVPLDLSRTSELDLDERLEALRLVATLLDTVHRAGMVHGRVIAASFTVSRDPWLLEAVDLDGVRVLGALPFTRRMSTIDDARRGPLPQPGLPQLDTDRFDFACLTHDALTSSLGWDAAARRLHLVMRLLDRSTGPAGTAPTMTEWRTALDAALAERRVLDGALT